MLGGGTLRVDARVRVNREALANAGLVAASLDADWSGARAVWLLEPDDEQLARAARAGVRVIVDATLAPGGHWLAAGADLSGTSRTLLIPVSIRDEMAGAIDGWRTQLAATHGVIHPRDDLIE